jgi:hypothetical protein
MPGTKEQSCFGGVFLIGRMTAVGRFLPDASAIFDAINRLLTAPKRKFIFEELKIPVSASAYERIAEVVGVALQ